MAASYTLEKLTRRESKKIPMKFLFLFYSFIMNLIVKQTYLQDIRIFVVQFSISNPVLQIKKS